MENSRSFALPVELPSGFAGERVGAGWVAALAKERESLFASGLFDPFRDGVVGDPTEYGGRGALRRLKLPSGPALVRQYLHGGLLRFFTGKRFADASRPFRELALAAALREAGIATPEPLAAAALGRWPAYRLFFVSREIEGRDLFSFLETETGADRRRSVLRKAGKSIRRLHDLGWVHADLHPKNLFVQAETDEIFFLDLDRSYREIPLSHEKRVGNLARLFRYGVRRQTLEGKGGWREEDFFALLQGYEENGTEKLAVEIGESQHRSGILHRLGWSLERRFAEAGKK